MVSYHNTTLCHNPEVDLNPELVSVQGAVNFLNHSSQMDIYKTVHKNL